MSAKETYKSLSSNTPKRQNIRLIGEFRGGRKLNNFLPPRTPSTKITEEPNITIGRSKSHSNE